MCASNWRPATQCDVSPVTAAVLPPAVLPPAVVPAPAPAPPTPPPAAPPPPAACPGVAPGGSAVVPPPGTPACVVAYGSAPSAELAAVGAVDGAATTRTSWTTASRTIGPNFPISGLLGTRGLLRCGTEM